MIVSSLALTLCGCSFSARQRYNYRFNRFIGDYTLLDFRNDSETDTPFLYELFIKKYEKQGENANEQWQLVPGGCRSLYVIKITTDRIISCFNPEQDLFNYSVSLDERFVDEINKTITELDWHIRITKKEVLLSDSGKTYEIAEKKFVENEGRGYIEFKAHEYKEFYANYYYNAIGGPYIDLILINDIYLSETAKYSYKLTLRYLDAETVEKNRGSVENEKK